ncbi:MAG: metal-dependent hydrolase [Candidatus Aenigmatarchaeota archaeon]
MLKRTHFLFAALLFLLFNIKLGYPLLFLVFALIGTAIPDIDIKLMHRRLLHNVWVLALIIFFGMGMKIMSTEIAISLSIGFLSHLIADALTVTGIMPFWPLPKPRFRGPFRTGGVTEYIIAIGVIVAIAYLLGVIQVSIPW